MGAVCKLGRRINGLKLSEFSEILNTGSPTRCCVVIIRRPLLHYTGLHWSVAIFIPDWGVVYITPL